MIGDYYAEQYHQRPLVSDIHFSLPLELLPGRKSMYTGVHQSIILDSSYNASPQSVIKIIHDGIDIRDTLYPDHKIMLVQGEMRELGDLSQSEHTRIGEYIYSQPIDMVALVGQDTIYIDQAIRSHHGTTLLLPTPTMHARRLGEDIRHFLATSDDRRLIIVK
jgi:UDP-N-acetylmuramyl pentapeptide synthase